MGRESRKCQGEKNSKNTDRQRLLDMGLRPAVEKFITLTFLGKVWERVSACVVIIIWAFVSKIEYYVAQAGFSMILKTG